jgi:predicted SAM-dependent methyltransferase
VLLGVEHDGGIITGTRGQYLEYCDEHGRFHYNQWLPADGPIYRSLLSDHRNRDGKLGFVSLIIDAHKPLL